MVNFNRIDTILLDGDGVLWRAETPITGIQDLFTTLNEKRINWALLTNNNTHTVETYVNKLARFGVQTNPSQVFTSSSVTAAYLQEKYGQGAHLHVVGMEGLIKTLQDAGFTVYTGEQMPPERVVAVVAGMDRGLTHDKVKVALRLILAGAPFIATNTDGSFVTPDGINPGTGMVIGALQATSGKEPIVIGKPQAAIFEAAMKRFRTTPGKTLMVGDRLNTDILGANRLGIQTVAVMTGVTSREELSASEIQPDLVLEDIKELYQVIRNDFG